MLPLVFVAKIAMYLVSYYAQRLSFCLFVTTEKVTVSLATLRVISLTVAVSAALDSFRDVAASCEVIPEICPLLASPVLETQLQALRATGNLCFDHGRQETD